MALSMEASAEAHSVPVAWLVLSLAPTPLTGALSVLLALNGSVALDRRARVELATACGSWRSVVLSRAATFVSRRPPAPSHRRTPPSSRRP